jgi:hypothetical protein
LALKTDDKKLSIEERMNIAKTSTIELDFPANDCRAITNLKLRVFKS